MPGIKDGRAERERMIRLIYIVNGVRELILNAREMTTGEMVEENKAMYERVKGVFSFLDARVMTRASIRNAMRLEMKEFIEHGWDNQE